MWITSLRLVAGSCICIWIQESLDTSGYTEKKSFDSFKIVEKIHLWQCWYIFNETKLQSLPSSFGLTKRCFKEISPMSWKPMTFHPCHGTHDNRFDQKILIPTGDFCSRGLRGRRKEGNVKDFDCESAHNISDAPPKPHIQHVDTPLWGSF